MPFQLDTSIPQSYKFGPGPLEQMKDVMSLADLMDQRKVRKLQIAEAERQNKIRQQQQQQAQEDLSKWQTKPVIPEVTAPDIDTLYRRATTGPMPMAPAPVTPDVELGYPTKPSLTYTSGGSSIQGLPVSPSPEMVETPRPSLTEFQARPEIKEADQVYQRQIQARQAAQLSAEPEARIPKGYQWMTPDEYDYYLKAITIDPDHAKEYRKELIDQKYKLAQAETAETKSKDLKDYQIGSILNTVWKKGQSPEEDALLVQGLISMGHNPVEARGAVDNAEALVAKYQSSPAMLGLGKLEQVRKSQEEDMAFKNKQEERANKLLELQQRSAARADAKSLLEMQKLRGEIDTANAVKTGSEYDVNSLISAIEEAKAHKGFATGASFKRLGSMIPGTPQYDFINLHGNIINQLSLFGRSKLKGQGQVSDYEGKMLSKAMSRLDLNLSEKAYRSELDRLEKYAAWKLANPKSVINSDEELRNIVGGQSIQSPKNPPNPADFWE